MKKKAIVLMILISLIIVTTITVMCHIETGECYKGVLIKHSLCPFETAPYSIVIAELGYYGNVGRGFAYVSECKGYIDEKIELGEIGNGSLLIDQCIDMMKTTTGENSQQISDEIIYPSATRFDYFTFLVYYTSNMPLDGVIPIEFVNLDCPVPVIKTGITVRGDEIRIGVWVDDCLSTREMKNSFTNNTKIRFNADNLIPPIECDLKEVEYVGYDCLHTILGDEHGGVCYDFGHYNLTFQIPPPVYDYEIEVLSNIKIASVEAYFFDFESIPFEKVWFETPTSSWHYYGDDVDRGEIYFVLVVPEKENFAPKVVTPTHIATTSMYKKIGEDLVEVEKVEYEVKVLFEMFDEELKR